VKLRRAAKIMPIGSIYLNLKDLSPAPTSVPAATFPPGDGATHLSGILQIVNNHVINRNGSTPGEKAMRALALAHYSFALFDQSVNRSLGGSDAVH
jgi:hypothetical protein